MSNPRIRVVRTRRSTPPLYNTTGLLARQDEHYHVVLASGSRRARRRPRRLIISLVFVTVLAGALVQMNTPSRHLVAAVLTRLLGSQTTAQVEATYHDLMHGMRAMRDAVAGAQPDATATTPSLQVRAHRRA